MRDEWLLDLACTLLEVTNSARMITSAPSPLVVCSGQQLTPIVRSVGWRRMFGDGELPEQLHVLIREADRAGAAAGTIRISSSGVRVDLPQRYHIAARRISCPTTDAAVVAVAWDDTDADVLDLLSAPPTALVWSGTGDVVDYVNTLVRELLGDAAPIWLEMVHRDDVARVQRWLHSDQGSEHIDARIAVGESRWHRLRRYTSNNGNPPRWFVWAIDVHEEHLTGSRIESRLAHLSAALAKAEAEIHGKNQFIATLSHELRAPLTTILLWERLMRDRPDEDTIRARAMDAIRSSAVHQSRLVGDLLDLSRALAGTLSLELRRTSIDELLQSSIEAVSPLARVREIAIASDLAVSRRIDVDAARLRQVFDNLLGNAVRFTSPGGSITVTSASGPDDRVIVQIRDTGRGIAPQALPRLFKPFTQVDDRPSDGLGIGLAIARQLIELHHGSLTAASDGEGRGATFTVTLPIPRRAISPVAGAPIVEISRLDGLAILVLDDDHRVREAIARLLGRAGARTVEASSTTEARELMNHEHPDILLCDIAMPGEDGNEFLRTLRSCSCRIPAIALSAYANESDRNDALASGFDAYLTKPFELSELTVAIRHVLAPTVR
ncbi:MAG: ATP-binding protein [Kofleriaceae bacterium]